MLDERDNKDSDASGRRRSSSRNSNNQPAAGKTTQQHQSVRRSIFSVLFNSSHKSSSKSSTEKEAGKSASATMDEGENGAQGLLADVASDADSLDGELAKKPHAAPKKHQQPADNDSYVLDLNKRLESERKQQVRQPKLRRNSSLPIGREPKFDSKKKSKEAEAENIGQDSWRSNANYIPIKQEKNNNVTTESNGRSSVTAKSPLLQEFINSHQIKFGPVSLNGSSESSDYSSVDSLSAPIDAGGGETRTSYWRALTLRPNSNIAARSPLQSSESELELLNCPAYCYTCSDDTSCSSVELVWSRQNNAGDPRNQSPRFGGKWQDLPATGIRRDTQSRCSTNPSPLVIPADISTPLPQQVTGRERILQRLSIFELAKPSKAKGRRFGESKKRRDSNEPARKSAECRDCSVTQASEVAKSQRLSVQWVANPLFANAVNDELDDDISESSREIIAINTGTQRQGLSHSVSHESVMRQRINQLALPWNKKVMNSEKISPTGESGPQPTQVNYLDEDSDTSIALDFSLSNSEENLNSIVVDDEFERYDRFNGDDRGDQFSRRSRKRWSVKSPLNTENNVYLNHIAKLDKRIKSNVISIKSQLSEKISDTSKRASVLADQLITSIKDTTKEQLLSATVWGQRDRRASDSIPDSFALNTPSVLSSVTADPASPLPVKDLSLVETNSRKKAELFSLIYKHQQQANGKPVITRQPVGGLVNKSTLFYTSTLQHAIGGSDATQQTTASQKPAVPPRPKSLDRRSTGFAHSMIDRRFNHQPTSTPANLLTCGQGQSNNRLVVTQDLETPQRKYSEPMPPKKIYQLRSNTISLGDLSYSADLKILNNKPESIKTQNRSGYIRGQPEQHQDNIARRRFLRRTTRRRRRATQIAQSLLAQDEADNADCDESETDGEQENFFKGEYDKFKSTNMSASSSSVSSSSRRERSRLRSLNYWRRFRIRRSGVNYNQIQPRRSRSSDHLL